MTLQVSPKGLGWFQDARFGMFIHWGLYSIIGKQEWVMHTDAIPVDDYEKLVPQFNPTKFNADKWASIAADAGQKYIVITSRHHDGFSMYDTSLSPYKVTNTPFKRDPLRELAMPVHAAISNSVFMSHCWIGTTRLTAFEQKVEWLGAIMWNSYMGRFANCVRSMGKWAASGLTATGRPTP